MIAVSWLSNRNLGTFKAYKKLVMLFRKYDRFSETQNTTFVVLN